MSPKKRTKPQGPTFRAQLKVAATAFGVKPEDLDRALIIGQVAGLLSKDPTLRGRIAHKGAAVLRLVDKSQRLSRDLDSGDIKGQRVTVTQVVRALKTAEARKVVLDVQPQPAGQTSASFLLVCRGLSGIPKVTVTLSINWSEAFSLPPRMADHTLPDGTSIKVPVMQAVESAAEKTRAFLTRGSANDAYDMRWYWTAVLTTEDRLKLGRLIKKKLASPACRLPADVNLLELFDDMRANAEREWKSGSGLTLAGPKPDWNEVDRALTKFKALIPHRRP